MPKINKEEYEILKELDEKGFSWITNTGSSKEPNCINAYAYEPTKVIDSNKKASTTYSLQPDEDTVTIIKTENGNLFQFIQWEDLKPYNISEMIEEYEEHEFYDYVGWKYYKKEKSEVKGIEWLKREIRKELEAWYGVEGGIDEDGINEIMLLINQFEESEVKRLDGKMKELESYNDELIRDNNQLRNELDNQEVLSEEWIERNTSPVDDEGRLYVWKSDLQSAIVHKPESPVIPQFVADFISDKEDWSVSELFDDDWLYREHDQIAKWLYNNDDTVNRQRESDLVFARKNGYTIEEEQKYYVVNNENELLLSKNNDDEVITCSQYYPLVRKVLSDLSHYQLTEQEIKDYDPRYWAFRKQVEELEE